MSANRPETIRGEIATFAEVILKVAHSMHRWFLADGASISEPFGDEKRSRPRLCFMHRRRERKAENSCFE